MPPAGTIDFKSITYTYFATRAAGSRQAVYASAPRPVPPPVDARLMALHTGNHP
jgi:hypothetical protein